mmetsp:Transcript_7463/g.18074  ORF Transcript_7463/g.18074 Transcript_7463/m.18074 type:complete len:333 (-) Transcript_7463:77-1075(-)
MCVTPVSHSTHTAHEALVAPFARKKPPTSSGSSPRRGGRAGLEPCTRTGSDVTVTMVPPEPPLLATCTSSTLMPFSGRATSMSGWKLLSEAITGPVLSAVMVGGWSSHQLFFSSSSFSRSRARALAMRFFLACLLASGSTWGFSSSFSSSQSWPSPPPLPIPPPLPRTPTNQHHRREPPAEAPQRTPPRPPAALSPRPAPSSLRCGGQPFRQCEGHLGRHGTVLGASLSLRAQQARAMVDRVVGSSTRMSHPVSLPFQTSCGACPRDGSGSWPGRGRRSAACARGWAGGSCPSSWGSRARLKLWASVWLSLGTSYGSWSRPASPPARSTAVP